MAELGMKKKEHNYLLDVIKWVSMMFLVIGHAFAGAWSYISDVALTTTGDGAQGFMTSPLRSAFENVPLSGIYAEMNGTIWYGWTGYYTIGFFILTSAYWFMESFKREQAMGLHRRGNTWKLTAHFFGDCLRRYWPVTFVAILINVLVTVISMPQLWMKDGIIGLWKMFRNAIPDVLGISALGFTHQETLGGASFMFYDRLVNPETGEMISGAVNKINYVGSLWFISALMIFSVVWYFVFLKSETFGVFVFALLNVAIHNNIFGFTDGYARHTALDGMPTEYCGT